MQFLILAYDATDADATKRRMAARDGHIATISHYKASGNMHLGAAILDDVGKMIGSVIIADFPSRKELDGWLAEEPLLRYRQSLEQNRDKALPDRPIFPI